MERMQFTAEQIIQILKEGRERITFGRSAANIRGCLERGNLSVQWMTQGTDPTDLSDAEWAVRAPLILPAKPGGRPRTTDMREVLNVIFYLLRGGGAWRLLPRLPRELSAWQPGKVRQTLSPRHSWGHYFVGPFCPVGRFWGHYCSPHPASGSGISSSLLALETSIATTALALSSQKPETFRGGDVPFEIES